MSDKTKSQPRIYLHLQSSHCCNESWDMYTHNKTLQNETNVSSTPYHTQRIHLRLTTALCLLIHTPRNHLIHCITPLGIPRQIVAIALILRLRCRLRLRRRRLRLRRCRAPCGVRWVADCISIHRFRLGGLGEGGFGGCEDVEGVEGVRGRGAGGYEGWVGVGSVVSGDVGVGAVVVVRVLVFVCVVGECG